LVLSFRVDGLLTRSSSIQQGKRVARIESDDDGSVIPTVRVRRACLFPRIDEHFRPKVLRAPRPL